MGAIYEVDFTGGDKATLRGWKAIVGYKLTALSPWLASFWVRRMADEWRGRIAEGNEGTGQMGWQPIETAPKDGSEIWVWDPGNVAESRMQVAIWNNIWAGWQSCMDNESVMRATLWQPLPAPPEKTES